MNAPSNPVSKALALKIERLDRALEAIAATRQRAKLASSLAIEDMVLAHAILSKGLPIEIFTLDTGRLHAETLGVIDAIRERYGAQIQVFHPLATEVDRYVAERGLNAFYESLEARQACCAIRKVEPLNRALADADAWITGQRREQSATREALPEEQWDAARGIPKHNPLAQWSAADAQEYAAAFGVPLNPLHARGYPSIGCEPCTRAVRPGEDARAGRWWWESRDSKECGLHSAPVAASPFPIRVVADDSGARSPFLPHSPLPGDLS